MIKNLLDEVQQFMISNNLTEVPGIVVSIRRKRSSWEDFKTLAAKTNYDTNSRVFPWIDSDLKIHAPSWRMERTMHLKDAQGICHHDWRVIRYKLKPFTDEDILFEGIRL